MAESGAIFSESWHRVAGQRVALRPAVQIRRQYFRGERWYVLQDRFNNQFYRFSAAAYQFLARLRADRTVQEVWEECHAHSPEQTPTQPEVIRLLSQLYQANLLQSELPPDSARLFERHQRRSTQQVKSTLQNLLFMKFAVWDPDRFLQRCVRSFRWLATPAAFAVWLILILVGLKVAADHWPELRQHGADAFAPDHLLLLYATFVITKAVHEFGHAFLCRAFGGEVHQLGVMLMILSPMPFVDATASWAFRSRLRRIVVAFGGMLFELAFAAIAVLVWAVTGPGWLHRFAGDVMFIASVSTLLFNINPLVRFDGYYILSDLLDVPNLASRAQAEVKVLFERFACGVRRAVSLARTPRERAWLVAYGIGSAIYRVVLCASLVLYIGDQFFELGLVLAVIFLIGTAVIPVWRFISYLLHSGALLGHRARAWAVTGGLVAVVGGFLAFFPFPHHFRAPGVVEAAQYTQVVSPAEGFVDRLAAVSGAQLQPDEPLFQLHHPELELQITAAHAERDEVSALLDNALGNAPSAIEPLRERLHAVQERLAVLERKKAGLAIVAKHSGVWVSARSDEWSGMWMDRGMVLGELIDPAAFRFTAVVSQDEAASLFADGVRGAEVRLRGEAGRALQAKVERIVPAQSDELPSAALGWRGGGEIAVRTDDPSGRRAVEPFFEVFVALPSAGPALLHHRSGQIRFDLPPQPLLQQWWRRVLQLVQKRYHI